MIIHDLHIKSIPSLPSKTDPILVVDPDAILARAIALQCLKPVRRWRRQISEFFGVIDLHEFPERDGSDGLKSPHPALLKNRLRILATKRTDQTNIVLPEGSRPARSAVMRSR